MNQIKFWEYFSMIVYKDFKQNLILKITGTNGFPRKTQLKELAKS
jgi:hypothetical protein